MFFALVLLGCGNSIEKEGKIVAKVQDEVLYEHEVLSHINPLVDSAMQKQQEQQYINQWIERQILLNSSSELPDEQISTIEYKVAQFKTDLLINALENQKINEQLDTTVTPEEIESYYKAHETEFQLNDYLVKVLYLKIPLDAPDIETIAGAYRLNHPDDLNTIEIYAQKYASNFYYDIESWIYFDDILKEIPLQDINKDRFILKRSKTRFEENGFYYFLNIVDYKLKNTISPLTFEQENIKTRIINSRIKKLREEVRSTMIQNGYNKYEIEQF